MSTASNQREPEMTEPLRAPTWLPYHQVSDPLTITASMPADLLPVSAGSNLSSGGSDHPSRDVCTMLSTGPDARNEPGNEIIEWPDAFFRLGARVRLARSDVPKLGAIAPITDWFLKHKTAALGPVLMDAYYEFLKRMGIENGAWRQRVLRDGVPTRFISIAAAMNYLGQRHDTFGKLQSSLLWAPVAQGAIRQGMNFLVPEDAVVRLVNDPAYARAFPEARQRARA